MAIEPTYTVGELVIKGLIWFAGIIASLFVALLTFLAKKHIANIEAVNQQLILIKSELVRMENTMDSKIGHLSNNVKNWKQGNDRLIKDVDENRDKIESLEKEFIKLSLR